MYISYAYIVFQFFLTNDEYFCVIAGLVETELINGSTGFVSGFI